MTSAEFTDVLHDTLGLRLIRHVILDGSAASPARPNQAELAVIAASVRRGSVWLSPSGDDPGAQGPVSRPLLAPGSPAALAAHRFAALRPAAKHTWLAQHLAALQADRISPARLP